MSEKYWTVKAHYDDGFWNEAKVRRAVVKGWITEEECEMILNGDSENGKSSLSRLQY